MAAPNTSKRVFPPTWTPSDSCSAPSCSTTASTSRPPARSKPDDFSLEKHRRIFRRMGELQDRGEKIDRITVANELMKFNELEACDGLSYLVSLDDGLPQIPNLDSYIRIVKDKAMLRRIIFASQHMMNRCLLGEEEPGRDPRRRRRDPAQAGRRARQDPASSNARADPRRTTKAASTLSSTPASASRASAPASPSSTR